MAMSEKVKMTLTFTIEASPSDAYFLQKVLRGHPGAPSGLRHYLGRTLEKVVKDACDGGRWKYEISGGVLTGKDLLKQKE
jgi:hypothetical protein